MKRLAALVIALLMALAVIPTFAFADDVHSVTYSGTTVDFSDKEPGATAQFYLDVTEYSSMFSGHWLVDYPDGVVEIGGYSVTWSGGIQSQVAATWDDEEEWSDKPAFVCNPNYEGQTGGAPVGEAGNMYANCGMYLTSAQFGGLQMGGHMIRMQFRYLRQPYFSECQQDETGWYVEVPVVVLESTYLAVAPTTYAPHEEVNVVNGKIYCVPQEDPFFGGILTVNYVFEDGTEAAPSVVEEMAQGTEYSIESPFIVKYDPDIAVVEGVMPNGDVTVTVTYARKSVYEVTYTGATVDATAKNVGDTFNWTFAVSEHSYMWSGHWLVDYPEQYVTPAAYSVTWSGGIQSQIGATWDDEEAWSDKPAFVCNMAYEGQTSMNPVGEAGNWYSNCGMYLTSSSFYGVQMGGDCVRITYRLDVLPPVNQIPADENGSYIEIPIVVLESQYFYDMVIGEDGKASYIYNEHEVINVVPGKVYVTAGEPIVEYTVTFYGYDNAVLSTQTVLEGEAATAPEAPEIINNENGTYIFNGWDVAFDNITADTEVHAIYWLLGDIDFNGVVNANDSLLALRYSLGLITLNDDQLKVGDVDFNGTVNGNDSLKIMRFALNIIDSLLD